MRTILFLCSGNTCRSRYAELLFNHLAEENEIAWRATSRGLMVDWAESPIVISTDVVDMLPNLGLALPSEFATPKQVDEGDLSSADLIIAVSESEHRPVFQVRFPVWEEEVEFWDIQDVVLAAPGQGLPQLTTMIELLVEDLSDVPVMAY